MGQRAADPVRAIHVPFDDCTHHCSVPSGLTIRP